MNNDYGPYGPPPQHPDHGQSGRSGQYPAYGNAPAPYGQPTGYGQYHPHGPYHPQGVYPQPAPTAQPPRQGWFSRHPVLSAGLAIAAALFVAVVTSPGPDDASNTAATPDQPAAAAPATSDPDDTTAGAASDEPSEEPAEDHTEEPSEEPTEEASEEPSDQPTDAATEDTDLAFGIGDAARAGDFEFVVDGIETGLESIGDGFLEEQAQGQYALVEVTVTNVGTEEATFYDGDQVLIDTEGREHSSDSGAWMSLDEEDRFFITDINPGNTTTGTLVFDIPTDADPASLMLTDGLWFSSSEVEVSLQ